MLTRGLTAQSKAASIWSDSSGRGGSLRRLKLVAVVLKKVETDRRLTRCIGGGLKPCENPARTRKVGSRDRVNPTRGLMARVWVSRIATS